LGNIGTAVIGENDHGRANALVPAAGALRPRRDPDAPELDEDDDGGQE
jgi:hypothetical protein